MMDDSVLQSFGICGNPFKYLLPNEEDLGAMPTCLLRMIELLNTVDRPESGPQSKKKDEKCAYLITQTAFNGLAKSLSKYMHIMVLIPAAASEIFDNLCQLFDFYLCAIFYAFVPPEERSRFLAAPNKSTAPAPNHARDYEALKSYLERTFGEVIYVPKEKSKQSDSTAINIEISDHLNGNSPGVSSTQYAYDPVKVSSLLKIPSFLSEADISTCYSLNERIVAAESCWFVAQVRLCHNYFSLNFTELIVIFEDA
jgi:hypothetical protein